MGAFVWMLLVLFIGRTDLALVPGLYITLTFVNIILCQYRVLHTFGCNFQIFISILLPFVFQLLMGGLASSGMVMLWSFVALSGVLTFSRGKSLYAWLIFTLLLISASIATDDFAVEHFKNPIDIQSKWFFAINGLLSACALFFIGIYFVNRTAAVKELLANANTKLTTTNTELNETNSELVNGLRYARTIQQAINPSEEKIENHFENSFCLQMPKDHVSGDFLWVSESAGLKIAACVDCTGHGIAGGLLAMMGSCIINGLVHEQKITNPSELLWQMNKIISERLNQKDNGNKDGMELTIFSLNTKSKEMKIATAGGSVYHYSKQENNLHRFRLNNSHVGGALTKDNQTYESKSIFLQRGDRVYLTTDGYTDQFGGKHNKKFSRKKLEASLMGLNKSSITDTKKNLKSTILNWKGSYPQTDDILVFGFEA